jgi:carbon monoxide dehydrogenase subunit G
MKVTGSATIAAPRDEVWKALNDPAVLVRTIPGVSRLEEIETDAYRMTIYAGVASIKGTYQGEVRLAEQQQPDAFVLRATGTGAPGTVNADVRVRLSDDGASTRIDYDADAVVGGMIGGVGQRVLGGVAKKTAGEFFSAVEDVLTGAAPAEEPATPAAAAATSTEAAPRVFEAPPAARGPGASVFGADLRGVLVGAGIALLGALVGGWISGRRRR